MIRLVALAAIGFYAGTAHLTRGHEADFGKQWLAARLVASGQGRHLYDLAVQRAELERHYDQVVIDRGIWRAGIGGPTYPPPLAILMAPLGWLSPRGAQWAVVELSIAAVVIVAWLLQRYTRGRVSWEICSLATLSLPPFFLAMGVGQNSAFSLLMLVGGLTLIGNGRDLLAGMVWGLFVYKPTWGVAVVWLPIVLGRPRVYLGMIATVLGLIAVSLPVCGARAWGDWLHVARQTEQYYQSLPRWTLLSRDLPGLLRRVASGTHIEWAGWALVLIVVVITAWTWRRHSGNESFRRTGPATVALLAGTVLSCPRFMFYDMTLAAVPVLVGMADWSLLSRGARWVFGGLASVMWFGTAYEYMRSSMLGPPLDTFALLGLWLWAITACASQARARSGPTDMRELERAYRSLPIPEAV